MSGFYFGLGDIHGLSASLGDLVSIASDVFLSPVFLRDSYGGEGEGGCGGGCMVMVDVYGDVFRVVSVHLCVCFVVFYCFLLSRWALLGCALSIVVFFVVLL